MFFYLPSDCDFRLAYFQANQNIPSYIPWKLSILYHVLQLSILCYHEEISQIKCFQALLLWHGDWVPANKQTGYFTNCHKSLVSRLHISDFLCSTLFVFIHSSVTSQIISHYYSFILLSQPFCNFSNLSSAAFFRHTWLRAVS